MPASAGPSGRPSLRRGDDHWVGRFRAMAGPCEVLVGTDDRKAARRALILVAAEARRIERKFSRYRTDSVVHAINRGGEAVEIDDETSRLLDFAHELWELSDGRFDVTSGALRRAWTFDGSERVPSPEAVKAARRHVGWSRVSRKGNRVRIEPGMEIDLGGIGKEYAVDAAARRVADECGLSALVNFGGDLVVNRPRDNGRPWRIGIEDPDAAAPGAVRTIGLARGGLATSGDARRYLLKDGVRYGHILDPRTGWPVRDAPRSVTVAASTCTQAGMIATLAMLEGPRAEVFLDEQGVEAWVVR